jgi:hypothetical protein
MSKCTRCEGEIEEDTGIRLLNWILCEICFDDI